ncbi:MAG: hypothetical protein JWN93_3748 [Hyphomicrobiales bacterium]|nr:hypothetical protein [Hyphomicrobiales bacterium]
MIPTRVSVLDVPVDCVDMDTALECADRLMSNGRPAAIMAINPEKVIACRQRAELRDAIARADLLIPDGIGVVAAVRLMEGVAIQRVAGADLMVMLCHAAARNGRSVYLMGGAPGVAAKAAERLQETCAGLTIAGVRDGYFDEADSGAVIEAINASGADILFIGMGSPRQELWVARHLDSLNVKLCQCVGGTIDVVAGHVKRAPELFRRFNLEWFYRLASQPSRIARQKNLPVFMLAVGRSLYARQRTAAGQ